MTDSGARAHDSWSKPQGGLRLDWDATPADTITVQGEGYRGSEDQLGAPNQDIEGADMLARWTHDWQGGASLQVQTYYDHASRATEDGGGDFAVDTYDLDIQDSFNLGSRNQLVWGGGVRIARYDINGTTSLFFTPASATLNLSNLFVQDSLSITDTLKLIVGLKGRRRSLFRRVAAAERAAVVEAEQPGAGLGGRLARDPRADALRRRRGGEGRLRGLPDR